MTRPRSRAGVDPPKRKRSATTPLAIAVGARIRDRRVALGLTGTALAAAIGVPSTALVAWEKGRVMPSVGSLLALAEAMRCSPAILLPVADGPGELFERIARLSEEALAELGQTVATLESRGGPEKPRP